MKAWQSRKLWITLLALIALMGAIALYGWRPYPNFETVIGAVVILGGGGAFLQYKLDERKQ